jgi:signal transduction histidine kinase/CheY-like chemotaxis protein
VKRPDTANEIYVAQIHALYDHLPIVLLVNVVNSALVSIVLASSRGQICWLVFLGLTVALSGARALGWARYCRNKGPTASTTKWAVAATAGSGFSGLLWGAACVLWLSDNLVEQTFVAFAIGGMCAASLVAFSNYLPAFIAYVLPASLPLAGRFFLDGWTVHGDMMVVFAAAIILAACNSTRGFVDGLRLNIDLAKKSGQVSAANRRLLLEMEQRRIVEEQLRQVHKLEAIGQLTGGIAHDFNNLLTVVVGHLEMARDCFSADSRAATSLQVALCAAERGAAQTRHLLAFARRQHLDPKPVDIGGMLASAEKLLKQSIGPEIELMICTERDLDAAWVDPNQLELAILNLALNARDAMPDGGVLRIDAENRPGGVGTPPPGLEANDHILVSVIDTGTGMDKQTLQRAFEPFFTTKEAGRGSGLGLSIVHGFAAQSGGSVRITSAPGEGTRVDLRLPRAESRIVPWRILDPSPLREPSPARILVCDDDPGVLTFVAAVLRDNGHLVWEANAPAEALVIIERERPELLVIDYAMSGMNGLTAIDRARSRRPDLRVILMSGHADVLRPGGVSGIPLLAKPFKIADLRERITEVLSMPDASFVIRDTQHLVASD